MLERAVTDPEVMDENPGTCLETAFRELMTIYGRIDREEGLPSDGDRMIALEETIASQPAQNPREAVMRVRALIAMREAEGGADQTLLRGLRSVLNDLIPLSESAGKR